MTVEHECQTVETDCFVDLSIVLYYNQFKSIHELFNIIKNSKGHIECIVVCSSENEVELIQSSIDFIAATVVIVCTPLLTYPDSTKISIKNNVLDIAHGKHVLFLDSDEGTTFGAIAHFLNDSFERNDNILYYWGDCDITQLKNSPVLPLSSTIFPNRSDIRFDTELGELEEWDLLLQLSNRCTVKRLFYSECKKAQGWSDVIQLRKDCNLIQKKYSLPLKKVRVIVVSYNQGQYIKEALDSALNQSGYYEYKIIVSDDGSTDYCPEIIKQYVDLYPTLFENISNGQHYGITDNYRRCIDRLDGDYVALLEGDDYWNAHDKIIKILDYFDNNPKIIMCFNDNTRLFEESSMVESIPFCCKEGLLKTSDFFNYDLNPIFNLSCCSFRCNQLKAVPSDIFNTQFSEISLGLYYAGLSGVGHIRQELTVYRIHQNGMWSGMSRQEKLLNYYRTRHDALDFIDKRYKRRLKRYLYVNFYCNPEFVRLFVEVEGITDISKFVKADVGFFNLLVIKMYMRYIHCLGQ